MNFKKLYKSPRVLILLFLIVLSILYIHPTTKEGVTIRSVAFNSSASSAGIPNPSPNDLPLSRERILSINSESINSFEEYEAFISKIDENYINRTLSVKTDRGLYRIQVLPEIEYTITNKTRTETITENVTVDNVTTEKIIIKEVPIIDEKVTGIKDIGMSVYDAPKSNLRKGLDLSGGTRVVLKPQTEVSDDELDRVISNMNERLNAYGLTDLILRKTSDLSGNKFIIVEIAGASDEDIRNLLAKQGKFEAKIGNETVFIGGKDSITYVHRSADRAGIDPQAGCSVASDGSNICRFRFGITLSQEAAAKQADATQKLEVIGAGEEAYLDQKLDLYLDDVLVDQLSIGAELKGKALSEIAISGSGVGQSKSEASENALKNMNKLQTILETGSLPVKLDIVQSDTISPSLGKEFTSNAILIAFLSILAVSIVIYAYYRRLVVALAVIFTMVSEVILLLGFAVIVGWNLDLASIAGIIIATGTGVDDQIVITDEVLKGKKESDMLTWKEKMKRAFFVIFAAYSLTVVAMLPLFFAGAGAVKGFAFTTIVGVTIGVFLTRPVFAKVIETVLDEDENN